MKKRKNKKPSTAQACFVLAIYFSIQSCLKAWLILESNTPLKKIPSNCGYQLQMTFHLGIEPHIHISLSAIKYFLTYNCAGLWFLLESLWVQCASVLLCVCIKYCILVHIHNNLFLTFFCLFCLYHWALRGGDWQISIQISNILKIILKR